MDVPENMRLRPTIQSRLSVPFTDAENLMGLAFSNASCSTFASWSTLKVCCGLDHHGPVTPPPLVDHPESTEVW
jgi:hypothetical protein